jgi:hypothetical protein
MGGALCRRDYDAGAVLRLRAVANVTGKTLKKFVDNVMPFATLHSDALHAYKNIGATMAGHHVVVHEDGVCATDKTKGTNPVESFFAQLKRSGDGTHHYVSREHLQRYLDEFSFHYGTWQLSDAERMALLVSQADGRLPYSELVGA